MQWQRLHGRHGLPWQGSRDPYRVWLSEVMLQQTQVVTAIAYFKAFVQAFPRVEDLAAAPADQVMALWSGLGYYGRARNLHAAAKRIMACGGGCFPVTAAELAELPGVGQSTAAAIAVFAFGERAAILDGNVKRVFSRVFGVEGYPGEAAVARRLWAHAQAELPPPGTARSDLVAYIQGLMDLGATLCTRVRPDCPRCPLRSRCVAYKTDAVARYPAPRPRRAMPIREVDMLLLCRGGAVLIEQRPPAGIWGGLWSLPEIPPGVLRIPVLNTAGVSLRVERLAQFGRFEHAFTHFRMKARVWRADFDEAEPGSQVSQATATRWLALDDAAGAPLPRPVKSLLRSLADRSLLQSIGTG